MTTRGIITYLICAALFLTATVSTTFTPTAHSQPAAELNLTRQERAWLASHPTLRLAFDGNFPPYSFTNDTGELEGIAIDVFQRLERVLGIEFQPYPQTTWTDIYQAGQRKDTDIIATMVEREERREWFSFTAPYVTKSLVVVTRADEQQITHRDELHGKKVALVKDYQYVRRLLDRYPTVEPLYVDNILDGLQAVATGQADATVTYLGAGHYYRTKHLLTNLKFAAIYDRDGSAESIAVRSDWPELAAILNKALATISEQEMLAMKAPWLPSDYQDILVDIELSQAEIDWLKAHPTIRVGVDPEFAPFEFIDNGSYSGMASDYLRLLNQRLNINLEVVKGLSWDEVIEKAQRGEIDVLPAVGKTQARQEYLDYTEPYLQFHRVIVTRDDAPFIANLSDLKRLKVGVQINSSHHGFLLENTQLSPQTHATLEEALLALSGGQTDALVGNVASATYWIRKLNLSNLKIAAPVSQDVQNLHFAVRKDWPELTSILQKGLNSISENQRQQISEKWLSIDYQPVIDYQLTWKILAAFSLLVIAVIIWNVALNRKVKKRTEQLLHQAYYDRLTELPNRFLIDDRLNHLIKEASQNKSKLAILSIDINSFKRINDTLGHEAGDQILIQVADRLRSVLDDNYTLGCIEGNQFLAILPVHRYASDTALVAETIIKAIESPTSIAGKKLTLTASIGIAIYPSDGEKSDILIRHADAAAHHFSNQQMSACHFYQKGLQQAVARKLEIDQQLRHSLERRELSLVYQPKIDINTGRLQGFEALLRWKNEKFGVISPEEFIPIAEANGLIEPIGVFALNTALGALAKLQLNIDSELTMAVNLSPRQFSSPNLPGQVRKALEHHRVSSQYLELEITEGVLLDAENNSAISVQLDQFSNMGIKLAMDDFGTGYSSLSYLRRYTFNTLKIDREFIEGLETDISNKQLVSATIILAHNLNLKVVAEGVETTEQFELLRQWQCDVAQGVLFGVPLGFGEVEGWVAQRGEELVNG